MSTSTMRNSEPIAAINVTPLVDVMLVLLIIFMITAPMMTQRLLLNLPQQVDKKQPKPPESLSLHIAVDGRVVLDGSALTPASLDAELAYLASRREPPGLEIAVDERTQYHHVVDVLALLKQNKLKRISFADTKH